MRDQVNQIIQQLDPRSIESMTWALDSVKAITDLNLDEKSELAKALCEVFFHAHHTGSTSMPKVAVRAEKRIAKFGPQMIPLVFDEMLSSDSESAVYFGKTIVRNGVPGLEFLLTKLEESKNQEHDLINIIQAISYFKIPEATRAVPIFLRLAEHNNHQVTSMALYAAGRLAQTLPILLLIRSSGLSCSILFFGFSPMRRALSGKMLRGLLVRCFAKDFCRPNRKESYTTPLWPSRAGTIIHNWDRAFIVRREAEDFLPYFHEACLSIRMYTQSYKIISKRLLCPNTYHYTIDAPLIARKIEAGQFLIVRPHIFSERIPLSVCGWNREDGTLDIIVFGCRKNDHRDQCHESRRSISGCSRSAG